MGSAGSATGSGGEGKFRRPVAETWPMTENRADIYARITNEIVAAIESGAGEWKMPWRHDGSSVARPVNAASGKPYRGINTFALWIAAHARGYGCGA